MEAFVLFKTLEIFSRGVSVNREVCNSLSALVKWKQMTATQYQAHSQPLGYLTHIFISTLSKSSIKYSTSQLFTCKLFRIIRLNKVSIHAFINYCLRISYIVLAYNYKFHGKLL